MANGSIDQLHFEVILDDVKFGQQITKDIEKAKELNSSLTAILNLKNKINATAKGSYLDEQKMAQAAAKTAEAKARQALQEQKVRTEVEKTALAQERARKAAVESGNATKGLPRLLGGIAARFLSVATAIRLVTRTLAKAIKNITEFQQANANLATIMQVSRKEIEILTNDALMLGRTTEWTASQVTELQTALAKLGYNIPQIRNMQASVLQFATAVGAKLPDAANLAGASLRMFGMHSTEMQKALEVLTASTNKTALDFEKLKVSLPYVGAIAHSLGMDIAQTSSMLGVLTNAGLESSRAGTGLRQVLLELSKQGGKLQTAMGGNIKTFDDFVRGLESMRDRGLDAGEATKLVSTRAAAALLILANGVDDIKRLNNEVRDTDGLLKTIQQDRLDTLHGSTLLLKSAWEGLIQTFRDSAGPMKDVVDWLTKIIRTTSLAVSRTNRIAQGTKNYEGSDSLTKEYTEMFGRLVGRGYSIEEATRLVREQMVNKLNGINREQQADSDNWWKQTGRKVGAWMSPLAGPLAPFVTKAALKGGLKYGEAAQAVRESMQSVMDYIENYTKEQAEIDANNYLDQWKLTFDTNGADAARAAANAVLGNPKLSDEMKGRLTEMKRQLEEYILGGGLAGINDRATVKGDNKAEKEAEKKRREDEKRLREQEQAAEKARRALEKYEETLRRWSSEDFDLGGTGFEYDIRKVMSDLNTNLGKVDEKYLQAAKEAEEAHKGNAEAIAEETEKLAALRDAEKAYARAQAQNKLDKLAESYLKDQYLLRGVDMDNIGSMSVSQLRNLKQEMESIGKDALTMMIEMKSLDGFLGSLGLDIENLTEEDIESLNEILPETTVEMIRLWKSVKDTGLSFDTLADKIQSAVKKGLNNLDEQEMKAIAKSAKYAAGQIIELAGSFRELGEATGNGNLVNAANAISGAADVARGISEGFRQGGPAGAVIGAVVSMGKIVLSNITESEREAARIAQSVREAAVAYEQAADALAVASRETVFGVDSMGKLREHMRIMEKYKAVLTDVYDALRNGSCWGDEFLAAYTDENGGMNLDKLKYDIENGLILGGGVEKLLPAIEQYKNALQEVDGIVESVFGDIASSAADKIVDSWVEAGNAALNYADILDDVARAYSKMLIQSVIMETALDPITEDLKRAFTENRYEDAMAMVANAMQTIEASAPVYEQILRAFDPYFNRSESASGGGGLSSGIKGITEDTANLLASYLNAIRADVSYIRVMQERGWEHINAFGIALPTLNDYIAQIAATNYDLAQSNQRILSELQSVIGAPGTSGMVVRVEAS